MECQEVKEYVINFYYDWVNNYISVTTMAEHYGLTRVECISFIDAGRVLDAERARTKENVITE